MSSTLACLAGSPARVIRPITVAGVSAMTSNAESDMTLRKRSLHSRMFIVVILPQLIALASVALGLRAQPASNQRLRGRHSLPRCYPYAQPPRNKIEPVSDSAQPPMTGALSWLPFAPRSEPHFQRQSGGAGRLAIAESSEPHRALPGS